MTQSKRDAIVERCLICGKTKAQHNGSLLFCPMYATFRPALAKQQSPVVDAVSTGTVSLTSFDGHCVRIDFSTREEAEAALEALSILANR